MAPRCRITRALQEDGVARRITAPFPSTPGRKGPRKRECIWRRAAAEPRLEIPGDPMEGGWEKQRLNSSAHSRTGKWMHAREG